MDTTQTKKEFLQSLLSRATILFNGLDFMLSLDDGSFLVVFEGELVATLRAPLSFSPDQGNIKVNEIIVNKCEIWDGDDIISLSYNDIEVIKDCVYERVA